MFSGNKSKAFVFTLDVLIALVLVVSFLTVSVVLPYQKEAPATTLQNIELIDSVIDSMDKNIYMVLDENISSSQKASIIFEQLQEAIPATIDFRIGLQAYDVNVERCREFKTFEECFPTLEGINYVGNALPTDRRVVAGKREYIAKRAQGRCVTGTPGEIIEGFLSSALNDLEELILYFQGEPVESDLDFWVDVNVSTARDSNVSEGDRVECDEDVRVDFAVGLPGRKEADIMLVIDRSGSMDECSVVPGETIASSSGSIGSVSSGTLSGGNYECVDPRWWGCNEYDYTGWQNIGSVPVTSNEAFSVLMKWTDSCGGECPETYIEHETLGTQYGFYGGTPPGGSYSSSSAQNYIFVPSTAASNGTWNVFGWNDDPAIDYNLFINYPRWEIVDTFNISNLDAFSVLLEWDVACSSGCPEMYVEHVSSGQTYGYYGGHPTSCDITDSETTRYLVVPSNYSRNGTWNLWVWMEGPAINYSTEVKIVDEIKTKMDAAQAAANDFVNYEEWHSPLDKIGVASFGRTGGDAYGASLDQQLIDATQSNKETINSIINGLVADGGTDVGQGIQTATNELTSTRARTDSMKFQIVLSDGKVTDPSPDPDTTTAANNAAAEGIKIYTIGFGYDADEEDLQNIASITGGQYYFAADESRLIEVYNEISQSIGAELSGTVPDSVQNTQLFVPVPEGAELVDSGGGVYDEIENEIEYNLGDLSDESPLYNDYFIIDFPCNNDFSCEKTTISFPNEETYFYYEDGEGGEFVTDWPVFLTVEFWYRNLLVDIIEGVVEGANSVDINVLVANVGYLASDAFTVSFYEGDGFGYFPTQLLGTETAPAFCAGELDSCSKEDSTYYFEKNFSTLDYIWAVIDENTTRDCPQYNRDYIYCYGGRRTNYYVLNYWMWPK